MSLTKFDKQQSSSSSSSVRRSSLLVNMSTTKKRSSVTTYLASSCSTLGSRKRIFDSYCSSTSAPITSQRSLDSYGREQVAVDAGASFSRFCNNNDDDYKSFRQTDHGRKDSSSGGILHTILVYPQSAPPTLNEPSYCIASKSSGPEQQQKSVYSIKDEKLSCDPETTISQINDPRASNQTNQQLQTIFQVIEIDTKNGSKTPNDKESEEEEDQKHSGQSSRKNSREESPEPIVEVRHTSSSSSALSSDDNSDARSSDNNNNSTKLVRRRTVKRYHRATVDEQNPRGNEADPPSSSVELTISINKSTPSGDDGEHKPELQKQERAEFGRGQFRTRNICGYHNHQTAQQQNHKQQQQQQQTKTSSSSSSSSSLTSSTSTSKIAKCSITTNRKSTTSHRELISESLSCSKKASKMDSKLFSGSNLTSTTMMQRDNSRPLAPKASESTTLSPDKSSQRLLELRLNNQFKGDLFDRDVEVKQQEESSIHHSRQSFSSSSTSTSMRAGSLRKAAMSSTSASEAASISKHSKIGALSSGLSALSSSSRHYKTSSASLTVSGNSADSQSISSPNDSTAFLNSESVFSSPGVRSLVKEIGIDFAELENALSSTTSGLVNRGASSLTSRLFGESNSGRRPVSPIGGAIQYPAIKGLSSSSTVPAPTSISLIHPVKCDQSQTSSTTDALPEKDIELPYKRNFYKSNLSSASESSEKSNSERIKELMTQAQSHVNRYNPSPSTVSSDCTKTLPARLYGSSQSMKPSILENEDQRRQGLFKEKADKDEGVKLHQSHCKAVMTESIERIDQRMSDLCKKFSESRDTKEAIDLLKLMIQMIEKAWSVPVCGDDLGFKLCNSLREAGGLDIILGFIQESDISRIAFDELKESPNLQFNNQPEAVDSKLPALSLSNSESQQDNVNRDKHESNFQAKNKASPNRLRLNLSKLNQSSEIAQSLDLSTSVSPSIDNGSNNNDQVNDLNKSNNNITKDSDSEMITSDLGLDSTSVDSLSYLTPPNADPVVNSHTKTSQTSSTVDLDKRQIGIDVVSSQNNERDAEGRSDSDPSIPEVDVDKKMNTETKTTVEPTEISLSTVCVNSNREEEEATRLIKDELVFLSARLLSQCLTSENRNYIVENGLDQVIRMACNLTTMKSFKNKRLLSQSIVSRKTSTHQNTTTDYSYTINSQLRQVDGGQQTSSNGQTNSSQLNQEDTQSAQSQTRQKKQNQPMTEHSDMHAVIGTEILQHLFKHSEDICLRMISLGGLEAILYGCRSSNIEILRHCASALANLALYGGPEGQQMMIEQKAHVWLFPLAFNEDDNIQYYACLAIVVLVANQEIEADVLKSSTLDLVEPFVTSHEPQKFAESTTSHIHGQSASWLRKLIPLLESKREEARNLACFHFAMEAYIKKEQGQTQVFKEIGAVEPLRKVGSSPIAIASKFACQALRLIGEKEPHKLSQQVPLWTSEDVSEWVSQIGFERFKSAFVDSRVDGDLLLQLDEDMLKSDIGIDNGIIRRRFLRELSNLKRIADYSSVDKSGLSSLLGSTGHDFVQYIYPMIQLGVTRENIHMLDSEQLLRECRITNTIHRMKLAHAIKELQEKMAKAAASNECCSTDGAEEKTLDVFMSYRRSTGSQLASLLKVFLELRNFSVFIDVERLEAGKFDNNLLDSIKAAKNFILILSPNALDRCIGDHECKDWVHKEIVAALGSNCNIIPIIDNFHWPDAEQLPEDMKSITYFNGVRWIHDYQDACVDKVERFIRGEINNGTSVGPQSIQSAQSSLQRLACGSTYSSTPSMAATPSIVAGFPSGSVSAYSSSRVPFDADYHPLSCANQYLQSQTTPSGGRRQL